MRCHCWNTNIDRWQKTLVVTLVKTKTIVNTIYKLVFKIKRQLYQQYWWILSELGSCLFTSFSNKLISALVWSCCYLNISCCDAKSSLRASSPIWASEASLARTRDLGKRSEPRENAGVRGRRKESLQPSLTNFHFHPGTPGTPQSVKTVTANVPQITKVTTACQVA